jgi:cellobiose phosphorylase
MTRRTLTNAAGLRFTVDANATVTRIDHEALMLNLFRGNAMEGGPCNLYLRRLGGSPAATALLGPRSPSRLEQGDDGFAVRGVWQGVSYRVSLRLARDSATWFWHVALRNGNAQALTVDVIHSQDLGLADYNFIRTSEYFASQYLDHTPLFDAAHGRVIATRQNLAMGGRHPWCLIASLHRAVSYSTDALQFHGTATRAGAEAVALVDGLAGMRLQHEHALVCLQDAPLTLAPGMSAQRGFVGCFAADHASASGAADLAHLRAARALPEAQPDAGMASTVTLVALPRTLFTSAPLFTAEAAPLASFVAELGAPRVEEKRGAETIASFHAGDLHWVSPAKENAVQRAHAQILRSGGALVPDEGALTSTVLMGGVFNSMLTQGHVGINRLLSSARGYLGLFRALGQRAFVEQQGGWRLLDQPSAWTVTPRGCRWFYRDAEHDIEVETRADEITHRIDIEFRVRRGAALRVLLANHIALDDDDGADAGAVAWRREGQDVYMHAHAGSAVAARFGTRGFRLRAAADTVLEACGGDELLFDDGQAHDTPYVCLRTAPCIAARFTFTGELLDAPPVEAPLLGAPVAMANAMRLDIAPHGAQAQEVRQWSAVLPWFADNALVHYLAPRGLEQFTGGGWGSRDICQGPLEMLLALGQLAPARDLLLRVFAAQNEAGDWPQWFTFFPRERDIRAGDSHGDIIFWPLMALARYLEASHDLALLDERVTFHQAGDGVPTLWQHVERALAHIEAHCLPGTLLIAYGHGDWNDSMQPASAQLRDELCSAWTVTLHFQMLNTLAASLGDGAHAARAASLREMARRIERDFQQLLVIDEVVPGYMHTRADGRHDYLLHPRDTLTGLHYSMLPIPHAILSGILTPAQAARHLALIEQHLLGPDGARLFDKPMRYRGGPTRVFQRAESAAFFGREIGLMYTHAHLRYAEALAHVGRAEAFFAALNLVNPVGLAQRLPGASPRPSHCYYSSSDAAFPDRYAAFEDYGRIARGEIAFDGGWRVYSSGPGLAIAILIRSLLGLRLAGRDLHIDPVMPTSLDGLAASLPLAGHDCRYTYRVGRRGHGVKGVRLNGTPLTGQALANPYREAGVAIALADVRRLMRDGENAWEIETF